MIGVNGHEAAGKRLPRARRAEPEGRPGMVLQERDVAVLEDVWRCRYLETGQIALLRSADRNRSLRFPSRQTLNMRLKLLYHHGYLDRILRATSRGSKEPVYRLDVRGAGVLSARYGEAEVEPASRTPQEAHLEHLLRVNEFRAALTAAVSQRADVELVTWKYGHELRKTLDGRTIGIRVKDLRGQRRKTLTLLSDALIVLKGPEGTKYYFLEVDRGTEPSKTIFKKCQAYYLYWKERQFGQDYGVLRQVSFRVLFLVISSRREQTVRAIVDSLEHGKGMFLTAVHDDLEVATILSPVWRSARVGEGYALAG